VSKKGVSLAFLARDRTIHHGIFRACWKAAILQENVQILTGIFRKYLIKTIFSFGVDTISCGDFSRPSQNGKRSPIRAYFSEVFWSAGSCPGHSPI
jgi:hypothetical protein